MVTSPAIRTCFIHIGTHRTASTSIQAVLSNESQTLLRHNILYPQTGRPADTPWGHHNLAWELCGDRRYRAQYGSVSSLLEEALNYPHNVVISSEDFQCGMFEAGRFRAFVRLLQANGLAVRIIVYLRNQVDYAQSLYRTMLLFGIPHTFDQFLNDVLRDGRFSWHEWIFAFCYRSLLAPLEALDDVTLDVRSYDRAASGSIIDDFFSILGLSPAAIGIDSNVRLNDPGELVKSVRLFYGNRKGSSLDPFEYIGARLVCDSLRSGTLRISAAASRRIVERFQTSNDYVRTTYHVEIPDGTNTAMAERSDNQLMDTIFSEPFARRIDALSRVIREQRQLERDLRAGLPLRASRSDATSRS